MKQRETYDCYLAIKPGQEGIFDFRGGPGRVAASSFASGYGATDTLWAFWMSEVAFIRSLMKIRLPEWIWLEDPALEVIFTR